MSKGQRGNKESKKPKKERQALVPGAPAPTVPALASAILERQKRR